jgi:hypothetical protein
MIFHFKLQLIHDVLLGSERMGRPTAFVLHPRKRIGLFHQQSWLMGHHTSSLASYCMCWILCVLTCCCRPRGQHPTLQLPTRRRPPPPQSDHVYVRVGSQQMPLGIAFAGRAMPTMKGKVQEDDYQTKVRIKDKIYQKIRMLASSGLHRIRNCNIADPGFGSGPISRSRAKLDGISPGRLRGSSLDSARTALPPNRTGVQHMMSEPIPFGCLGQHSKEKEIAGQIPR